MADQLENRTDEPRELYDPVSETPMTYVRGPEGAHPPVDCAPGGYSFDIHIPGPGETVFFEV